LTTVFFALLKALGEPPYCHISGHQNRRGEGISSDNRLATLIWMASIILNALLNKDLWQIQARP